MPPAVPADSTLPHHSVVIVSPSDYARSRGTSRLFRCRKNAFPLELLSGKFPVAADCLGMLTGTLLRGLLIVCMGLGFPKDAFSLQLLLQHTKCLVDVVVSYEYLQNRLLVVRCVRS